MKVMCINTSKTYPNLDLGEVCGVCKCFTQKKTFKRHKAIRLVNEDTYFYCEIIYPIS